MKKPSIRVMIVDDDVFACEALRHSITSAGMEISGIAHSGDEAIAKLSSTNPNAILWDDSIEDIDGIEALREIQRTHPSLPTLIMVVGASKERYVEALAEGAYAVLEKRSLKIELIPNILEMLVANTGAMVDASAIRTVMQECIEGSLFIKNNNQARIWESRNPAGFTFEEFGILQLLISNYSAEDIASELMMSHKDVAAGIRRICAKLQIDSVAELDNVIARMDYYIS